MRVCLQMFVLASVSGMLGCSLMADLDALSSGLVGAGGAGASVAASTSSTGAGPGPGGGGSSSGSGEGGVGVGGAGGEGGQATGGGGAGGDAGAECPGTAGPTPVRIGEEPTSYCIDSTEVTVAQYKEFLEAAALDETIVAAQDAKCAWNTSLVPQGGWTTWWSNVTQPGEANDPVRLVDWCDAYAYCKWAGKELCGARAGGAIAPAEAKTVAGKWVHACSRSGQRIWPYGAMSPTATSDWPNEPSGICVDGRVGGQTPPDLHPQTDPVGSHPLCEGGLDGIYDLSGNVAEWLDACDDGAGDTPALDTCLHQGGSYNFLANATMCSFGQKNARSFIHPSVGFRCCSP